MFQSNIYNIYIMFNLCMYTIHVCIFRKNNKQMFQSTEVGSHMNLGHSNCFQLPFSFS